VSFIHMDIINNQRKLEVKLFYVVVMALSLGGCTSTNTKDPDICRTAAEYTNRWSRRTDVVYEAITEQTGKKSEFYELKPLKVFSGIDSANLTKNYLTIKITDKACFEQYSAPVVNTISQYKYEAHPFTGTFTPVGMFVWLLHPKEMNAFTFGCIARGGVSSEPDTTRKVKTGKSEWRNINNSHKILVSGFDKDYEFDVYVHTSPSVIDLSSAISNTELTKNTILKVACLDCDLLGAEEQNLYKGIKASVELDYDFRAVKALPVESVSKNLQPSPKPLKKKHNKAIPKRIIPPINDPLNIRN